MPLDLNNADHLAAVDEAGHCVNARKRNLHIQFTTIEHQVFQRAGQLVTGPVTMVNGCSDLLLSTQNRVAGAAAILALSGNPGRQQDVREAIEAVQASGISDAEATVQQMQNLLQTQMGQPAWSAAIERVALHLLQVRTIEEIDADTVIDALL